MTLNRTLNRTLVKLNVTGLIVGVLAALTAMGADAPKPKYGPKTTPLSADHGYFRKAEAPDYWAVSAYVQPQRDPRSCSLATFATTVNTLRALKGPMTADEKMVAQAEILDKVDHPGWNRMFKQNGKTTSLEEFTEIAQKAMKLYGIEGKKAEFRHIDKVDAATTAEVRKILVENEKSSKDLVIINALQSELTGDPEGAVGHLLNVGAYDAAKDRVLLIDPDREYYEPYWVDLAMLMKGMNTLDKDAGKNRGLIWIR